jgi:hypothetical protein
MKRPAYLKWIRQLPCCLCGNNVSVEAAHIRFADRSAGKRETGMGEKSDDMWALPLCGVHHAEQHKGGERKFWDVRDPVRLAMALWIHAQDTEKAEDIINAWNDRRKEAERVNKELVELVEVVELFLKSSDYANADIFFCAEEKARAIIGSPLPSQRPKTE